MKREQFRLLTMALYIIMRILLNKKDKAIVPMMGKFAKQSWELWIQDDEEAWARYIGQKEDD